MQKSSPAPQTPGLSFHTQKRFRAASLLPSSASSVFRETERWPQEPPSSPPGPSSLLPKCHSPCGVLAVAVAIPGFAQVQDLEAI